MDRKTFFLVVLVGFLANSARADDAIPGNPPAGGIGSQPPSSLPGNSYETSSAPPMGGWTFGASLYYLKPYYNDNIASVSSSGLGTANPTTTGTEFDWNFQPAFRVWLGYTCCSGLGFRAGYFQFDNSADPLNQSLSSADAATSKIEPSPTLPVLPGGFGLVAPGLLSSTAGAVGTDFLTFNSNLSIKMLDLEATYAWNRDIGQILFSGGARYGRVAQGYSAVLNNPGTDFGGATATEQQSLDYNREFEGWGLTAALEGLLPLTQRLSLFGGARGSFLVGTSTNSLNYLQIINDPTAAAGGSQRNTASVNTTTHSTLPILELELGAQYRASLGNRASMFLRAALVNQTYFGAGNASSTEGNLGLFGGQFSLGFGF